ncbi:RNA polymerase, sigma-24 subunit, RpoE, ECF subfamily [Actinobacteria bacterium OK074]|nr:RNA polymerase, sigma-24 subunit, RpoE, ECF subfamily [Actinobacteria bacterium OK074]
MVRWHRPGRPALSMSELASAESLLAAVDVGRVRGTLVLGGVPWNDLDDGVQVVRLKLLEECARPDRPPIREPAAWVSVVASRVAVDWHRAHSRDAGLRDRLAARWERQPDPPQEQRLLALTVAEALDALTSVQRQVLTLRFYADLPVREIAELLDVPEGTVKSRLHAAVSALRVPLSALEVG